MVGLSTESDVWYFDIVDDARDDGGAELLDQGTRDFGGNPSSLGLLIRYVCQRWSQQGR